ncbi:guanylate kinase [Candidatus Latescibacterota bacterium]
MNKESKPKGLLIVISAPSGAGKTSILFEGLKRHPDIKFSVSATTRKPRSGEKEGVNYYFLSDEEFEAAKNAGELLEWNAIHGNKYGTLKRDIDVFMKNGENVILDTDTIGAFNIKKQFPESGLFFIVPPSPEVLRERLEKRSTETPESIERRFKNYPSEISRMDEYDYIIVNDDFNKAVSQFSSVIEAEKLKSSKILPVLSEWRKYING